MDNSQPNTVPNSVYDEFMETIRDEDLDMQLEWAIDYWKERNSYIDLVRMHLEGLNPIEVPTSKFYKAKTLHSWSLTSIVNEKQARYLTRPAAQVIIEDPTDQEEVDCSSEIEKWLDCVTYEAERIGDGDVHDRILVDVHLLDQGVKKWLFNPQQYWKELVEAEKSERPLEGMIRENYKKVHGTPIECKYVPLENFLPIYDGSHLQKSFEVDVKSMYSCKKSPVFDMRPFAETESTGRWGELDLMVPIIHFCNDLFYAYYALNPGSYTVDGENKLKITPQSITTAGDMSLLYLFKHGLGRSVYNPYAGRFGGWRTQHNRIEVVNKGILAMSQAKDELFSQIMTTVRAEDWPTMKFKVDPEKRGYVQGGTEPLAPKPNEGEEIVLFIGEELEPMITAQSDPKVPWLMNEINGSLGNLGGSSVLFGHRQPGVDTGYQNQQQITQAEHLDSKVEEHLQHGAVQDYTIIMQMAKVFGETLYAHYTSPPDMKDKRTGKYISLDPSMLDPMPRIDAKVRKTRPIDFMAAGRLANELSNEREGKGPLLSDHTIGTEILARDNYELEKRLIRIEKLENEAIANGTVTKMIQDATNLKVAKQTQQQLQPGAVQQADPALIQAALQILQQSAQQGGVADPNMLIQMLQQALGQPGMMPGGPQSLNPQGGNVTGHPNGGMLSGDSQPEARIGEMMAAASGMR